MLKLQASDPLMYYFNWLPEPPLPQLWNLKACEWKQGKNHWLWSLLFSRHWRHKANTSSFVPPRNHKQNHPNKQNLKESNRIYWLLHNKNVNSICSSIMSATGTWWILKQPNAFVLRRPGLTSFLKRVWHHLCPLLIISWINSTNTPVQIEIISAPLTFSR